MSQSYTATARVQITPNGPYLVSGGVPLGTQTIVTNQAKESVTWQPGADYSAQAQYALCRCGHSASKPFCDGSHAKIGFDGTETASRKPYREQAKTIKGSAMTLTDAESLCAAARFCDPNGQVWQQVTFSDQASVRAHFILQTGDCPSGRLVAWDNATGAAVEPAFAPSIALIEDPAENCLGPLWLRGGVQVVAADGFNYEVRNRVTLCRCGASKNKPFCDGSHISIGFNAQS